VPDRVVASNGGALLSFEEEQHVRSLLRSGRWVRLRYLRSQEAAEKMLLRGEIEKDNAGRFRLVGR